jgi:universal stress protein A
LEQQLGCKRSQTGVNVNIKKILFPADFSESNASALAYATSLASTFGAELHIVHVDESENLMLVAEPEGYAYAAAAVAENRKELKAQLEKIKPTANVSYRHHFLQGVASVEIRALAEREEIDLIVMSSHGRTGLSRLLMGSVAENVLRHAKCPVLILKLPAMEQGAETNA